MIGVQLIAGICSGSTGRYHPRLAVEAREVSGRCQSAFLAGHPVSVSVTP